MTTLVSVLLPLAMWFMPQVPAAASENACAVCHLRLAQTQSRLTHVDQWVTSKHAWFRVGCEQCHGGDATTGDERVAHRGIANSADPASAVNRSALPTTCGRCHATEATAFARSAHRRQLAERNPAAPTCTSCHSSMAADIPSPGELERQCRSCHGDDQHDRAGRARHDVEQVSQLRRTLSRAKLEIAGVMQPERRTTLLMQWTAADASLWSVVASLHAFDLAQAEARLIDSQSRIDRLVGDLRR